MVCLVCGMEFKSNHHHALYCSDECRKDAKKMNKPVVVKTAKASITIEDMVEEALRLSKESGHVVSYGDVQAMMMLHGHEIKKKGVCK